MANGKTWERNCHTDSRLLTQSLGDREMIMNGKWKTVKLGDVFTLQMGKTPDRNKLSYFSKVGNKWISIADITKSDKFIKETKECITDVAVQESGIKKIPQNTVIMSFKLSIGKTAITTEECYSNEAIMAFLPNGLCDFDNNYLYHLFSNKNWSEGSNKAVKGITLNKESLSNVYIPLPPLETQQKIAAVLDKVQKIISESKAILEKYDTLIKSRFPLSPYKPNSPISSNKSTNQNLPCRNLWKKRRFCTNRLCSNILRSKFGKRLAAVNILDELFYRS